MFWGCNQAHGLLSPMNGVRKLLRIVCIITEHGPRNGWTCAQRNINVRSWCIRICSSSNTRVSIVCTVFPYACIHKLHTAFTQCLSHSYTGTHLELMNACIRWSHALPFDLLSPTACSTDFTCLLPWLSVSQLSQLTGGLDYLCSIMHVSTYNTL